MASPVRIAMVMSMPEGSVRLTLSADGHINEPGDLWSLNLPRAMVDAGPRVQVRDGKIAMVVEGRVIRRLAMSYATLICIQPPSDMEGRSIGFANHRRWPAGVSAVRNWVS